MANHLGWKDTQVRCGGEEERGASFTHVVVAAAALAVAVVVVVDAVAHAQKSGSLTP